MEVHKPCLTMKSEDETRTVCVAMLTRHDEDDAPVADWHPETLR